MHVINSVQERRVSEESTIQTVRRAAPHVFLFLRPQALRRSLVALHPQARVKELAAEEAPVPAPVLRVASARLLHAG